MRLHAVCALSVLSLLTVATADAATPQWIWATKDIRGNDTAYFRKVLELPADVKKAQVAAACDNVVTLYVNAQEVLQHSDWSSPARADVTKKFKKGSNVIALRGVNDNSNMAGMILRLDVELTDGKKLSLVTDTSWKASGTEAKNWQAASFDDSKWSKPHSFGNLGVGPWNNVALVPGSAPPKLAVAERGVFRTLPGFEVQHLYTVPKNEQGSWVCLTTDHKGRLLASDQGNKGIYRITPPGMGNDDEVKVEKLSIGNMSAAQGMLAAFDSLYFSVNGGPGSGFYRARDTNDDDQYDELVKLKAFQGGGEHGPHALRLSPDGKSIYVIAGNHTNPPADFDRSRIPKNWSEDLLLPRQWDARGHARGKLAPGGWIATTDPDGKTWEMISVGYRNPYDMDFNADGELFAYDADMEWDMGMPWYRPTRVVHATSGSEFGWRSGTGKWPNYYPDSLPTLIDIGPGSPVGATFGYGAKFPAKYQKAFYVLDWTFGTIYAVHIEPKGASYKATKEEFVSRTPLPLTDAVVGKDGALYFTVGGRGTQSELFRVVYTGDAKSDPVDAQDNDPKRKELRALRRQLESLQAGGPNDGKALAMLTENLGHNDRHIRYAARVALEHRSPATWQDAVLKLADPTARINAAVAVARQSDESLQPKVLAALGELDFKKLTKSQKLECLRAYALAFIRMGAPDEKTAATVAAQLDPSYPADDDDLNRELCRVLVYLQSDQVVPKTIALMRKPREQNLDDISELLARNGRYGGTIAQMLANMPDLQKLHYAFVLRNARRGWTVPDGTFYFQFLKDARQKKGGASYGGFLTNMENDAFAGASDNLRLAVEAAGLRKPPPPVKLPQPKGPGHDWTLDEVLALGQQELKGRDFENGKRSFAAARCVVCHRFGGEGGATGPDLTQAAGRFNFKDLSEAILDPSKVISDQYRASTIETESGKLLTGRIAADNEDGIILLTDPEDSTKVVKIARDNVAAVIPSKTSLMPSDLLKPLNENELLDLMAYLLSRGNKDDAMFK